MIFAALIIDDSKMFFNIEIIPETTYHQQFGPCTGFGSANNFSDWYRFWSNIAEMLLVLPTGCQ
jgi:hypothetical protein